MSYTQLTKKQIKSIGAVATPNRMSYGSQTIVNKSLLDAYTLAAALTTEAETTTLEKLWVGSTTKKHFKDSHVQFSLPANDGTVLLDSAYISGSDYATKIEFPGIGVLYVTNGTYQLIRAQITIPNPNRVGIFAAKKQGV